MSEEELFEKFLKEELELEVVDPLEYIYWRDSIAFASYRLRETITEEMVKGFEPALKAFDAMAKKLSKLGGKIWKR